MLVYATSTEGHWNVRFHKSPDCSALKRGQKRRNKRPVQAVKVQEIERPEPCKHCFPDAPVTKVWHPKCDRCNGGRLAPCEHNGGVLVQTTRTGQWVPGGGWDPTLTVKRYRYVWPENAHHYRLVQ